MPFKRFTHPCASGEICREARAALASLLQIPLRPSLGMSGDSEPAQPAGISQWRAYPVALHMALYDGDAAIADGATAPAGAVSWHYRELRREAPRFRPGEYLHSNHDMIVIAGDVGQSRACDQCGLAFAAERSTARFCSAGCRKRASRRQRVTLTLGAQAA